MKKDNYFILTGAMGAGKSTLLSHLRTSGLLCIDEPARKILAEQREIAGRGVPELDPSLFTHLLLSRSIYQFQTMQQHQGHVIYDRGIADNVAYAELFGIDVTPFTNASSLYQYNQTVFFLPAWQDIYCQDEERKMTFQQATTFGDQVKLIYQQLGYSIVEVPKQSPEQRAAFILNLL